MQLLRYAGWLLRCCYVVASAVWVVSTVFLFGFWILGWLLRFCNEVAKVLRVVAKRLLGYSERLLGCCYAVASTYYHTASMFQIP